MQQLRQHTFGCGHCALCVAAKSVFALFAGFLTLALTFASTLILSSVLFTSPAFAQVNAENSGSAASAQTAATTQNASNKTAGQSDSAATANAGNTSEKANAALATNSASTSKNAGSAAASAHRARRKMRQTMVRQTLARKRQITAIHKQIQRPFLLRI